MVVVWGLFLWRAALRCSVPRRSRVVQLIPGPHVPQPPLHASGRQHPTPPAGHLPLHASRRQLALDWSSAWGWPCVPATAARPTWHDFQVAGAVTPGGPLALGPDEAPRRSPSAPPSDRPRGGPRLAPGPGCRAHGRSVLRACFRSLCARPAVRLLHQMAFLFLIF